MAHERDAPVRPLRRIAGLDIAPVGLGTAPISIEGRPSAVAGVSVITTAVEHGITFIDTADAYCIASASEHGYGERLVREALSKVGAERANIVVATKGGEIRPGDGRWLLKGDADYLRTACEASLVALGVDVIDLYQLHRPDPKVPLEESLGAMVDLRNDGLVRSIGVCNVTAAELDLALSVAPIASVQNAFSIVSEGQDEIIARCERQGIAFVAHSPFGGPSGSRGVAAKGLNAGATTYSESSPYTAALARLLDRSSVVVPIPGTTRPGHVADIAAALRLEIAE